MDKLYSDMTDIREGLDTKTCMNDMCKDNIYTHSRPIILLSNICWNCKKDTHIILNGDSTKT